MARSFIDSELNVFAGTLQSIDITARRFNGHVIVRRAVKEPDRMVTEVFVVEEAYIAAGVKGNVGRELDTGRAP